MPASRIALVLAVAASSLMAVANGAPFARMNGFGPEVADDTTLNANLGVLAQQVAWLNSPDGDVFQIAVIAPVDDSFGTIALDSSPFNDVGKWSDVRDDKSLKASLGVLSEQIAWQNTPAGDVFQIAEMAAKADELATVTGADFQRVAMASIPRGGIAGTD